MVQRKMENRPVSPSDCQDRHPQAGGQLAELLMRQFSGLARRGQLAAAIDHDLLVSPFQPRFWRNIADAAAECANGIETTRSGV
jgi:hypothetical protein